MAATVSLWLDSLCTGVGSQAAQYVTLYKASSFATLAVSLHFFVRASVSHIYLRSCWFLGS